MERALVEEMLATHSGLVGDFDKDYFWRDASVFRLGFISLSIDSLNALFIAF